MEGIEPDAGVVYCESQAVPQNPAPVVYPDHPLPKAVHELTDEQIIGRLTHVTKEGAKCVFDFWRFKCPSCDKDIKLEHREFVGQRYVQHFCVTGATKFNFAAVVGRWKGIPPTETHDV